MLLDLCLCVVIFKTTILTLWLFSLIAEITFRWGIMNISQHAYVSLVPPQYAVKSALVLTRMSPLFSFVVFGFRSCGMPFLFGLTVPQQ